MKKYIIEINLVGEDQIYDFSELTSHISRYFDQSLYEYTIYDYSTDTLRLRRTYDEYELIDVFKLIYKLRTIVHNTEGRLSINNFLDKVIIAIPAFKDPNFKIYVGENNIVGTTWSKSTFKLEVIETTAKKIESIKYID